MVSRRVGVVWSAALLIIAMAATGFMAIPIPYVIFAAAILTVPALLFLSAAESVERRLLAANRVLAARFVGIAFGFLVPLGLYLIAPNKANAMAGLVFIGPVCLGTGLIWSLTSPGAARAAR